MVSSPSDNPNNDFADGGSVLRPNRTHTLYLRPRTCPLLAAGHPNAGVRRTFSLFVKNVIHKLFQPLSLSGCVQVSLSLHMDTLIKLVQMRAQSSTRLRVRFNGCLFVSSRKDPACVYLDKILLREATLIPFFYSGVRQTGDSFSSTRFRFPLFVLRSLILLPCPLSPHRPLIRTLAAQQNRIRPFFPQREPIALLSLSRARAPRLFVSPIQLFLFQARYL